MQSRPVVGHVGHFLTLFGLFTSVPTVYAFVAGDEAARSFLFAALIMIALGFTLGRSGKRQRSGLAPEKGSSDKYGLAVVTVGWLTVSVAGALPFWLHGTFPHWTDALFESVSGFTTTGATVMSQLETKPRSLLLWRSMLQWLGGMGIVVLFLSVFPRLGMDGFALYRAEVAGPDPQKALPRLAATSKLLWSIYILQTVVAFSLLSFVGLPPFDAFNHALSTVSTGGFSTRTDGLLAFDNSKLQWALLPVMFFGGMNFLLQYRLVRDMAWRKVLADEEFKLYTALVCVGGGIIALSLWLQGGWSPSKALSSGLFQAASTLTTTGYTVDDYGGWPPLTQTVLFALLFVGGSAGSTSGGLKVIRLLIGWKHAGVYLRQVLHPRSVAVVRVGERAVSDKLLNSVTAFFLLYWLTWFVGIIGLGALGLSWSDAVSASIAALGNTGTAFGATGPVGGYASFSPGVKMLLASFMIIGRLEVVSLFVMVRYVFSERFGWSL